MIAFAKYARQRERRWLVAAAALQMQTCVCTHCVCTPPQRSPLARVVLPAPREEPAMSEVERIVVSGLLPGAFRAVSEWVGTIYLLLPLLGGAVAHGLCMKHGWFAFLARPIDGGAKWRGQQLFGHSKTFRGPILVAAGSAAVFAIQSQILHGVPAFARMELLDYAQLPGAWFAALAGAAAELAELPNSFAKRRLRIPPGGTARGLLGAVFFVWDQIDLLLGYWLVVGFAVPATPIRVGISLVVVGLLHPLVTVVGYLAGMRKSAR
jgi:hypothetical protein